MRQIRRIGPPVRAKGAGIDSQIPERPPGKEGTSKPLPEEGYAKAREG